MSSANRKELLRAVDVKRLLTLSCSLVLLSACGARVRSYPYDEHIGTTNNTVEGFVYGLPKTIFEITAKVNLCRRIYWNDRVGGTVAGVVYFAKLDDGISIAPKGVLDPSLRFRVDPKYLKNWRVHTKNIHFKMTKSGIIQELNADFQDRTAQIIESTARTAINVGKMIAMAGAADEATEGVLEEVATFDLTSNIDPSDLRLLKPGGKTIFPDFRSRVELNASKDISEKGLFKKNEWIVITGYEPYIHVQPRYERRNVSSVSLQNSLGGDSFGDKFLRFITFENAKLNYLKGLVTRLPGYAAVQCRTRFVVISDKKNRVAETKKTLKNEISNYRDNNIAANKRIKSEQDLEKVIAELDLFKGNLVYEGIVPVSQFGRLGVIPVHSNTFVDQTKSLTVNTDSGALDTFNYTATSSGETVAKMFENISKSVMDELPGIIEAFGKKKGDSGD